MIILSQDEQPPSLLVGVGICQARAGTAVAFGPSSNMEGWG